MQTAASRAAVTPAVLIPRPETELLVELALERLDAGSEARVLDLGTGSGCIATAIACHRPRAQVVATDSSAAALAVARENMARQGVRIELLIGDWYDALPSGLFDLIVSNPPYVAAGDPHLESGGLRYEPETALVAGPTGYECLEAIVAGAEARLARGGWLLLEHGYDQAAGVRARLTAASFREVFTARDLAGIERVSGGRV